MEAIDLIYPSKLSVAEKRMPVFDRLQVAFVQGGQVWPVPRLVSPGLGEDFEPLPPQPLHGGELFVAAMSQLIGGWGGHALLVAAGLRERLEPMDALLDALAVQAFQMVQSRRQVGDGREHLLAQLRSELFLKVPTAGPLDLLRTEEAINRFWRELYNQRDSLVRLRTDLQNDLQQVIARSPSAQWSWRISLVNGRLRARQVATR